MSGINLKEMEAEDMLDVIHYIFEEDTRASSAEEVDAKSKLRTELYSLYGRKYAYGVKSSSSNGSSGGRKYITDSDYDDLDSGLSQFSTDPTETKGYIEPTDFNPDSSLPFGGILDAPLG